VKKPKVRIRVFPESQELAILGEALIVISDDGKSAS